MKAGTSENLSKNGPDLRRTESIDNFEPVHMIDKISAFQRDIAVAKHNRQTEIEAPQEIIDHLNPGGLGGAKYFHYHGIMVFPPGAGIEIKKEMAITQDEKLHGFK